MEPFLTFDHFVYQPPAPSLFAVSMTLGLVWITLKCDKIIQARTFEWTVHHTLAVFFCLTGSLGMVIHGLAMLDFVHYQSLQLLAWSLAFFGILQVAQKSSWEWCTTTGRNLFKQTSDFNNVTIIHVWLLLIILLGMFFNAIAPVTDADSLAYHLAAPLDFLRHGRIDYRPDWFELRLLGLGEFLNLLGLAGGTDCWGAMFQFVGILIILLSVIALFNKPIDKVFIASCILSCPLLIMLISVQKYQLFPVAGTTLALILIVHRFGQVSSSRLFLAFSCLFLCMGIKYSFILTGGIVWIVGMLAAFKSGKTTKALLFSVVGSLIILLPILWTKFQVYGDPLTPLLERFRAAPDPAVLRFADKLKSFTIGNTPFPMNVFIPTGNPYNTMGIGVFLMLAALKIRGKETVYAICGLCASGVVIALGQTTARFFLEPFFWTLCGFSAIDLKSWQKYFFFLFVPQMLLVAMVVWYGVITLFPGSLSSGLRENIFQKTAYGYAESKWQRDILPRNSVLFTSNRDQLFASRPFFNGNCTTCYDFENPDEWKSFYSILQKAHPNIFAIYQELPFSGLHSQSPIKQFGKPQVFQQAGRSPWWQGASFSIFLYEIDLKSAQEEDLKKFFEYALKPISDAGKSSEGPATKSR